MPTITKTVEIPEDRRLKLDIELPEGTPTGSVEMEITISPAKPTTKAALEDSVKTTQEDDILRFAGILKGSNIFPGDSVALQRKWRAEWDRPWDRESDDEGE